MSRRLNVAVVHLDLGIGGAERLMVDAALSFKSLGHNVEIYTSHHDKTHCFEETIGDGALASNITVLGDWLPRHIFGKFTVFCAVLRMLYIALMFVIGWTGSKAPNGKRRMHKGSPDLVFIDGVSAPLILLHFFGFPTIFYCHFPDMLLCTKRESLFKSLYRSVFDKLEEISTGHASLILVNSNFTQQKFAECFPNINSFCPATVLYPTLTIDADKWASSSSGRAPAALQVNAASAVKRRLRRVGEATAKEITMSEIANKANTASTISPEKAFDYCHLSPKQVDRFVFVAKDATAGRDSDATIPQSEAQTWAGSAYGEWGGTSYRSPCKKGLAYSHLVPYTNNSDFVFLSLNRYERKKNISLALLALKQFKKKQSETLELLSQQSQASVMGSSKPVANQRLVEELHQLQIVYVRQQTDEGTRSGEDEQEGLNSDEDNGDDDEEQQDSQDRAVVNAADIVRRARTVSETMPLDFTSTKISPLIANNNNAAIIPNSPVKSAPPIAVVDSPKSIKIRSYSESSLGVSPMFRDSETIYAASTPNANTSENNEMKFFALGEEAEKYLSLFHSHVAKARVTLVIAGGYDSVVRENVEYLEELKREAASLGLSFSGPDQFSVMNESSQFDVVFRTSVSNLERQALLKVATGLLYTPDMEHFGIVPLEAMVEGTPVVAVNSGGPRETVVNNRTGYLCAQTPGAFADAMYKLLRPVVVHIVESASFRILRNAQRLIGQQHARAIRDLHLAEDSDEQPQGMLSESKLYATIINNAKAVGEANRPATSSVLKISVPSSIDNDELHTPVARNGISEPQDDSNVSAITIGSVSMASPVATIIMPVTRRLGQQCKKHVVDNFSIESMKSGLNAAIFVALGASRAMSQIDLLDRNFQYSSFKRIVTGNMKRLDEYSSMLFLSVIIFGAISFAIASILLLSYYGNHAAH